MKKKTEYNWMHEEWVEHQRHGSKVSSRYERAMMWKAIKEDLPFETGLTTVFIDEETFYMQSGLYVIAAGTGQGKTTLALNIAAANCEKKHVLFQSMDWLFTQLP